MAARAKRCSMTVDWLFIGYVLGFATAAWVCPLAERLVRKYLFGR